VDRLKSKDYLVLSKVFNKYSIDSLSIIR